MHKKTGTSSTKKKKQQHLVPYVRQFRDDLKMTQEEFAEIIDTDRSNYAKKEKGNVPLTLKEWVDIVEAVRKKRPVSLKANGEPQFLPNLLVESFLPDTIQVFPVLKKIVSESNEAARSKDKKLLIKILEYAIEKLKEPEVIPAEIPETAKLQQDG